MEVNPDKIKVWGFYLVSGQSLEKLLELEQLKKIKVDKGDGTTLRERVSQIGKWCQEMVSHLEPRPGPETKSEYTIQKMVIEFKFERVDLGPVLFVVLPSGFKPVTFTSALHSLLSADLLQRLSSFGVQNGASLNAASIVDQTELKEQLFKDLQPMLQNLANNDWADWAWEDHFIKPSLASLTKFAFQYKHMPGMQTAAEIGAGEFNAVQHHKVILFYVETFLQHLNDQANTLADLEAKIRAVEARDAFDYVGVPLPPLADVQAQRDYRVATLRHQVRSIPTLRPYQKEAVEKCLADNRVIHLPTGAGKTLIAVKLIDYYMQSHTNSNILFIVPTRALVEQQAQYIQTHSLSPKCTVQQLCGMEMESWNADRWTACQKASKVLVGTSEVFRASLVDKTFMQISSIALIIFDECHNATGNSPMANIMRDSVKPFCTITPAAHHPRIVGLTASFVNGKCENVTSKR